MELALHGAVIRTGYLSVLFGFDYCEGGRISVEPRQPRRPPPSENGSHSARGTASTGDVADPACRSDADLVQETRDGHTAAFDLLVERHLSATVGFFRYLRVPPNSLEDLVQDTFLRAFRKLDLFDPTRTFSVWLLTIGRNLYFDQRRKNSFSEVTLERADIPTPGPEDEIIERHSVQELLESLPEEARFLLELRIFRDLPFPEIAELTGESESTLRVRFHRLMQRLRLSHPTGGAHET